uniref:Kinesin motor domain-containing protein n=1 Tax=Echinostoma caproni TaxID=27848 RepID=A0A183ATY9_9TREM
LKSTVDQLRNDMTKIRTTQLTPTGLHPRPPRSTSCRAIPDNLRQHESHETLSLNSLTSGASSGLPDCNSIRTQSPGPDLLTRHSPSPTSDGERTPGKRSRWIRPGLGRAFKKRSKSSMNPGERSTAHVEPHHRESVPTATVCSNPGITRNLLPPGPDHFTHRMTSPSPQTTDHMNDQSAQSLLHRMRWELSCLEADNKRLRRLILNAPELIDPPDSAQAHNQNVVTLTGDQIVHIYVELEPSPFRNAFMKLQSNSDVTSSPKPTRNESGSNKLMKIGCVGVRQTDGGTSSAGWQELDEKIGYLLQVTFHFDYRKASSVQEPLVPSKENEADTSTATEPANGTEVEMDVPEVDDSTPDLLVATCFGNGVQNIGRTVR